MNRKFALGLLSAAFVLGAAGCHRNGSDASAHTSLASGQTAKLPMTYSPAAPIGPPAQVAPPTAAGEYLGMDRNDYPGDAAMAQLRRNFSWTGYWLTVPPGAQFNTWIGKRDLLGSQGWGFLVLANGELEKQILTAGQKQHLTPALLGQSDAVRAVASARIEKFPAHTIIFLDQEEGGRLTDPQAAYLLAWTEAVAKTEYAPGVYASGQIVHDDPGAGIDTVQDIRARIRAGHLHDVAIFDTQDACPPSNGCTLQPQPLSAAGEPDLAAWQYSQSPRRPAITQSCAATYAKDGNCYAPSGAGLFLDMSVAKEPDPSHGR